MTPQSAASSDRLDGLLPDPDDEEMRDRLVAAIEKWLAGDYCQRVKAIFESSNHFLAQQVMVCLSLAFHQGFVTGMEHADKTVLNTIENALRKGVL